MLRRVTTSVVAAAALIGVAAAPANALVFGSFDGPPAERDAVVRIHMLNKDGIAECTGTAVTKQWVLTAQHCIEGLARDAQGRISGTVTTKEGRLGNEENTFQVNEAHSALETNPALGDVALLHVTRDLNVEPVGIDFNNVSNQQGSAYGWSTLGMGATGRLPRTDIDIKTKEQHPLYKSSEAYVTTSKRPAQLQQGDSGGPLFVNGKVAGVLSVGIGSITNPVNISGTYMHASMDVPGLQEWINNLLGTDPGTEPGDDPEIPGGGSIIPLLPVIPGTAEIINIVGAGSL